MVDPVPVRLTVPAVALPALAPPIPPRASALKVAVPPTWSVALVAVSTTVPPRPAAPTPPGSRANVCGSTSAAPNPSAVAVKLPSTSNDPPLLRPTFTAPPTAPSCAARVRSPLTANSETLPLTETSIAVFAASAALPVTLTLCPADATETPIRSLAVAIRSLWKATELNEIPARFAPKAAGSFATIPCPEDSTIRPLTNPALDAAS